MNKFSLYNMPEEEEIVNGIFEKIGDKDSSYTIKINGEKIEKKEIVKEHVEAIKIMLKELFCPKKTLRKQVL